MIVNIPVSIDENALTSMISKDADTFVKQRVDNIINKKFESSYYADPLKDLAKEEIKKVINDNWDSIEDKVIKDLTANLARTKKAKEILNKVGTSINS